MTLDRDSFEESVTEAKENPSGFPITPKPADHMPDLPPGRTTWGAPPTPTTTIFPVGMILPYLPPEGYLIELAPGWVLCGGQILDDPAYIWSKYYRRKIPQLIDNRFLMGAVRNAYKLLGSNTIPIGGRHRHVRNNNNNKATGWNSKDSIQNFFDTNTTGDHDHGDDSNIPNCYGVLYVIKVLDK